MSICINAWRALDTCRQIGTRPMAVKGAPPVSVPFYGPIPWTAIEQYARFHELDRESAVLLVDVITQLDIARAKQDAAEMKRKP